MISVRSHEPAVTVFADAILLDSQDSDPNVLGMSLCGPEQAVRAIAASCSMERPYSRCVMDFDGERRFIGRGRWGWSWSVLGAGRLAVPPGDPAPMHMVVLGDKSGSDYLVVPHPDDEGVDAAIYNTLLREFTTPLMPAPRPDMNPREKAMAVRWRQAVVTAILSQRDRWTPCYLHPDSDDKTWERAGILNITESALDELVSQLVKTRRIHIAKDVAAA